MKYSAIKANNSIFDPEKPKIRCFTSQSIRKKEIMLLNEVPNYQGKHIQNINTLISLKINEKDVSDFQKPNSNTLMNLKHNQLNLYRNQYNSYESSYYSNQMRQSQSSTQTFGFKEDDKFSQTKDDKANKQTNNSQQKAFSNVQPQKVSLRYQVIGEQQTQKYQDEVLETLSEMKSPHYSQMTLEREKDYNQDDDTSNSNLKDFKQQYLWNKTFDRTYKRYEAFVLVAQSSFTFQEPKHFYSL